MEPTVTTGIIVDERFRLTGLIGSGALGVVYRAEQVAPLRAVAVKMLKSPAITPADLARFEREVQILSTLRHRNIVKFYTYGFMSDGSSTNPVPYIAMEFVDGSSLADTLQREALTIRRALGYAAQICEGLRHAHKNGIVHRDLKPSNVFLVSEEGKDVAKVGDFGLAKVAGGDGQNLQKLIDEGLTIGTLAYMSPEQMAGQPATPQSDIYALGSLLFECLLARPIVEATEEIALALQLQRSHVASMLLIENSNLPGSVREVLRKTLACDINERYKNVEEVLHAIDCCLRSEDASDLDCIVQVGNVDESTERLAELRARRKSQYVITAVVVSVLLGAVICRTPLLGAVAANMRNRTSPVSYRVPLALSGAMAKIGMNSESDRFFDAAAQQIRGNPNTRLVVMQDLLSFSKDHPQHRADCTSLLIAVAPHIFSSDEFDRLPQGDRVQYLKEFAAMTKGLKQANEEAEQHLIIACLKQATSLNDMETMNLYLGSLIGTIHQSNSANGRIAAPCLRTLHQFAVGNSRQDLISGVNALLPYAPFRLDAGQLVDFIRAEADVVEDLFRTGEAKLATQTLLQLTPAPENNLRSLAAIRLQIMLAERFKDQPKTSYAFTKNAISKLNTLTPISWERMDYERRMHVLLMDMPESEERSRFLKEVLDLTRYDAVALLDHANNSNSDFGPTGLSPDTYFYILDNLPSTREYGDARLFSLDELIILAHENDRLSNQQLVRVVDEFCRAPETFRPSAIHCCEVLSETLLQKHLEGEGVRLCDAFLRKLPPGELHDRMVFLRNKFANASRV